MIPWRHLTAVALLAVLGANVSAASAAYVFRNMIVTPHQAPSGNFTGFGPPAISGGALAFGASYGTSNGGIFRLQDGVLTTIAKGGDPGPQGPFIGRFFGAPTIHQGTVAFVGISDFSPQVAGVFTGTGGPLTTIAHTGDPAPIGTFTGFSMGNIHDSRVAFVGYYNSNFSAGVFVREGNQQTPIVQTGDSAPTGQFDVFNGGFRSVLLQDDAVTFVGDYDPFPLRQGVFVQSGQGRTTLSKWGDLAPVGDFIYGYESVSRSESTVAFTGTVSIGDAVPTGVFAASGGAVSMIAKEGDAAPNGVFSSFREVAVDGSRVAFLGTYNNLNDEGIFLREPGGGLMPLIKEGDSLFGSTVRFLEISRFGFDDDGSGELGFAYGLTDGRRGIALATQTAAADFDANGYVDSDDLDAWRTNFGMAGGAASTHGDADGDGAVTGADFLIWQRQLGGAGFPSPVQSAPEPLSIVLSVLGLGGGQLSRPGRRQQDSRGDRRRRVR